MNVATRTLVSSRGLPNLARKRQLPGGTAYRAFDRPIGTPLFIPSGYVAATTKHPVVLRLVKSRVLGKEPVPYGVLEVIVEPAAVPTDVTPAVPHTVTASLTQLTDMQGHNTAVDNIMVATGTLLNGFQIRFQWVLDSAISALFSSALTSGVRLFEITVRCKFDTVNVDRLIVGSEPEPDVVQLDVTAAVQLSDSADGALGVLVDEEEVSTLPDGNWRVEIDSVLDVPIAGIAKLGVQITAPPNPPRRASSARATAWLETLPTPLVMLRLLPREEKSGQACVVAMAHTDTGVRILEGPAREHSGPMFMIRPDDLPIQTVQIRPEAALLNQGEVFVDVIGAAGQTLYGSAVDFSGATFASTNPDQVNLVAKIISDQSGEVAVSTPWPFRSGVVDRAWFTGFGSGTATIRFSIDSSFDNVELHIRLNNQNVEDARIFRVSQSSDEAQWRYVNTGPFTPQCLYRVVEKGSETDEWSGPVKVATNMSCTRNGELWQLSEQSGSIDLSPDQSETSTMGDIGSPVLNDNPDNGQEPNMDQEHTEIINGIECRWHDNDPTRLAYKPPAILPALNSRGEPLISLTVAGGSVSVQVSAEWALPTEELLALRAAFAQRTNANEVLISMSVMDVGSIIAELVSIDEAGQPTTIATTPTTGFGSNAAALHAAITDQLIHTALSAAFSGGSNRLLVKYTAADLALSADVGHWLAGSTANHIITIPDQ